MSRIARCDIPTVLAREGLTAWTANAGARECILRKFQFKDFAQAWRFMSLVADKAEKMDHHPEWFNVYNTVEVALATHTCNGVSEKDIELAKAMDEYAKSV
jgi:4a-hydroxytetrahydrobiopterin dehydratase